MLILISQIQENKMLVVIKIPVISRGFSGVRVAQLREDSVPKIDNTVKRSLEGISQFFLSTKILSVLKKSYIW